MIIIVFYINLIMKEMIMVGKKKKIIVIIGCVCLALLFGGFMTYLLISGKATSLIAESSNKAGEDESGVDWSKYQVYDVDLGSGNVNITKAGVYNLKGTLKNGSVVVSTDDNVKLVLNGVTIKSNNGPAINIKQAKNTYIELVGDSKITSKTSDSLDAAIFSKDDVVNNDNWKKFVRSLRQKEGIVDHIKDWAKDELNPFAGFIDDQKQWAYGFKGQILMSDQSDMTASFDSNLNLTSHDNQEEDSVDLIAKLLKTM